MKPRIVAQFDQVSLYVAVLAVALVLARIVPAYVLTWATGVALAAIAGVALVSRLFWTLGWDLVGPFITRTFFSALVLRTANFTTVRWLGKPILQNTLDLWTIQETIFDLKPALIIERLESGITRLAEGSAEEIVEARYAVQAYSAGKRIFFWAGVAPHCNCTGRRRITPSTQRTISARPSISAAFSRTRKSGPSWASRNVEPFCMTCISTSAEWPL